MVVVVSVVVAAVLGALVGSVLTVIAWRVPRRLPLRAGQPTSTAGQPPFWTDVPALHVGGRGETRWPGSAVAVHPPVMEMVTGGLFAVMTLRFGVSWSLPAYLTLAACAVLLSVVDLQHHRLPDAIVGPFAVAALFLLAAAAWGSGTWEPLVRAVLGAVILFVFYLVLALISPGGLGMGDVKLAAVLGLFLAFLSWRALIWGAAGGFVIIAVAGAVLLAARRATRQSMVPFGPAMLLATVVAAVVFAW